MRLLTSLSRLAPSPRISRAHLSTTTTFLSPSSSKPLPPRTPIPDSDLIENFLKGSGPGGQKINKTSSAVQLIHKPTGIVVKYQDTRSREMNRKRARRILQDRLEEMELGEGARTRVKAREVARKKASSGKKARRKYRKLAGEGEEGEEGAEEGAEDVNGGREGVCVVEEERGMSGLEEKVEIVEGRKAGG